MMTGVAEDEEKWLAAGIAGLQQNAFYMHRAMVSTSAIISDSDLLQLTNPNFDHFIESGL